MNNPIFMSIFILMKHSNKSVGVSNIFYGQLHIPQMHEIGYVY